MSRSKKIGLPEGIRKRKTAGRPGFVYEIYFRAGPTHGRRFERIGTDLREAKRQLAKRKREIANGTYRPGKDNSSTMTVAEFAEIWLKEREGEVLTVADDRTRFRLHILPEIGNRRIAEVEAYHIVQLLEAVQRKTVIRGKPGPDNPGKPISKSTVLNIYGNLSTMFADAEQRGYIVRSPCAGLRKSQRPQKPQRAETQGTALTEEQLSDLISDNRIPEDRRTFYALHQLTGTRFGEAAGFRWKDYDTRKKPLGHLRLERQYEDKPLKGRRGAPGPPRDIPVHPTLAAILAEWRLKGFVAMVGRRPRPDDFIVPSRMNRCRSLRHSARRLAQDCERVGIEAKEATHIARRTFVTLAVAGGASESWVRRITHNANGDVLTGYQVNDWPAMCAAVRCIKVERRRRAQVVELKRKVAGGAMPVVAKMVAKSAEKAEPPAKQGVQWRGGRDLNPRPPA